MHGRRARVGHAAISRRRLLAAGVGCALGLARCAAAEPAPPPIDSPGQLTPDAMNTVDEGALAALGVRKLTSRRLTLYTDLPAKPAIDDLPAVFDQAFPQWCQFFEIPPGQQADWRVRGSVIADKAKFLKTGLLDEDVPPFLHGYSRNYELWLYDQPSDYYRRHLLLHEGTHSFMRTMLGRCGPPWYMEGTAELLGTHRWDQGRLTLNYFPQHREDVPMWGRIKIINDAVTQRRPMSLDGVVDYSNAAHRTTEPYAWCWAAAALLDRHPRYQARFHQLYRNVQAADFNDRFRRAFADDWQQLCEEWQLLVVDLQYGQDIPRTAVDFAPGQPLRAMATVQVAADHGWQNSGLRLEAGVPYQLSAAGRYQVARRWLHESRAAAGQTPPVWWCEPGGISARYYRGRPLGMLLATVRPDAPPPGSSSALLRPYAIGLGATLTPEHTGTLFLRINDSPAELADNAGTLSVQLQRT